jgi:hypothetical protein
MRVLDLSQQLPGPYATQLLASLGAKVTKIEPPSGDAGRHLDAAMFNNVNAGKESITLDLKTEIGKEALYNLVPSCDVFIEGFRPGVTSRLGCDYSTLKKIRPDLVYCSISGFGQSGPLSTRPSHDISLQSMAGALPENSVLDRIGVPWVDLATGTSAALAITALWHKGEGGYLDISMLDAALAWSRVSPDLISGTQPVYSPRMISSASGGNGGRRRIIVSSSIGMNCSIGGAKVGSSISLKSQTGAVNGSHFSERASLTESSVDIFRLLGKKWRTQAYGHFVHM